jgi:hypothetical protein
VEVVVQLLDVFIDGSSSIGSLLRREKIILSREPDKSRASLTSDGTTSLTSSTTISGAAKR